MVAHATFHWPLDAPLDAKEVGARLAAAASKLRLSWRCAAIVEYWVTARRKRWMTEEAARAQRHRTLLEDNPTSG
jgi:hypothetical protein